MGDEDNNSSITGTISGRDTGRISNISEFSISSSIYTNNNNNDAVITRDIINSNSDFLYGNQNSFNSRKYYRNKNRNKSIRDNNNNRLGPGYTIVEK